MLPYLRFCFLLLCLAAGATLNAQVFINELLASNAVNLADPDFQAFSDWVELYNAGNSPADLSGWTLSDDQNEPTKWTFPAGSIVPAGGFLLVWADGESSGLHAGFKLSADGETLSLYTPGGTLADEIGFGAQQTDVSCGRKTDGGAPWGLFPHPSPGASNNTQPFFKDFVRAVPVFSKSGGFFDGPVTVDIQNLTGYGVVRYTTDGSSPASNSPVFSQPLNLSATTVVKARLFLADRLPGPVVTNTYFIGEHFEERGLAVLSISTHPDYFFAQDSGIYVQNFKPDWEVPVHLEFYEADGLLGFHHDAGASIGGENAWILPEKMLNIFSRKQYGGSHIEYQLFPGNPRTRFEDIILRCSGNDWSNTLFRDGMQQGLAAATSDLDIQDFRPCAVYINGQYFGIHNIREKQDKEYTDIYHGIDPDSLDYIENNGEVKEGNALAYQQMVDLLNAGVQSDAAFQLLDQMADTRNFTDYIISEIFTANTSWGHNIALFRAQNGASRWRWLPHDYDRGFDLANVGGTSMDWATATNGADWTNPAWGTLFLRKMLENNTFKQAFITRFADHLYVTYNPATIDKRVDRHADWIRGEIPYHVARWAGTTSSYGNGIPSVAFWENEVAKLKTFGQQRNAYMWQDLDQYFNLDGSAVLNVELSAPFSGRVQLHDLSIPSYPWTGKYFINRQFTLTATARPGFQFVRWEKLGSATIPLIDAGASWAYRDAADAPPATWNQPAYDAGAWPQGPAQLGYGDGDEATQLSFGSDANNKTPAYYFRKTFTVADPASFTGLLLRMVADDGAVVYLNGQEVWRYNMPAGAVQFNTLASGSISGTTESAWLEQNIAAAGLVAGENLIAVEMHQAATNSSDLSFDFEVKAYQSGNAETVGLSPVLDYSIDGATTLRAVFEPDGNCGVLPDTVVSNLTLTAACSPYRAAGDVVVKPDVTLSVEPGVAIQFPEKANLWVLGDLQVNGSASQPVLITNAPDAGVWGGILLKNTTETSSLKYLTLLNASAGQHRMYFPAAISAYHADLNMDHLDLTQVSDNPVFSRFSNVVLTNSDLKSLVTGDCINIKQGSGRVENCRFEALSTRPDMDAIDFDGVANGIIRNNTIHDFRGDNCDGLDIGESCSGLLVENNFIYHCLDKGISVGQQSSALIRNNTIVYTGYGIALKDQSPVQIDHCTFFGNQTAVAAYEKNPGNLGGNGIVTNCIASNAAFAAYSADTLSSISLSHCLSDTDTLSGSGNLSADPHFVLPTFYDFHLLPGSAATAAGADGLDLGASLLPAYSGEPQLMLSEILYDDTLTTTGEFVEIYNPGSQTVDLEGYVLANAIDFVFPAGAAIAAGEYIVVAKTAASFNGAPYQVFEWTDGKLANEGEAILLYDGTGLLVEAVRYDNHAPWPEADGLLGRSLELVAPGLDNHFATSWQPSENAGGSPGAPGGSSGAGAPGRAFGLLVFPNPADALLSVRVADGLPGDELLDVQLTDALGNLALKTTVAAASGQVSVGSLQRGLYFVRVKCSAGEAAGVVVKN